jgi:carbon starvation protein CstA
METFPIQLMILYTFYSTIARAFPNLYILFERIDFLFTKICAILTYFVCFAILFRKPAMKSMETTLS